MTRAGQVDQKSRAPLRLTLDGDIALVALEYRMHDRQAQARALARLLGGEKRVEDILEVLLGDADSGIAKFDPDLRGVVSLGANPELSAPGHGLNGVGNQVQKHLPQGILVGKTRPHLAPTRSRR